METSNWGIAVISKTKFIYVNKTELSLKAVVAGPAGRRAPDHFFAEYAFRRVPFSAHFTNFLLWFYSICQNLLAKLWKHWNIIMTPS